MPLTVSDVAKVALLARLRVDPSQLETFAKQLNSIVDYVAQLQELDTTGVEPLAHGVELRNVFRDDRHLTGKRHWLMRLSEIKSPF
jgi:aspartyl-tRNA(Asn)/glutamyl-tRNA(Gln) amidotransferase subunit C